MHAPPRGPDRSTILPKRQRLLRLPTSILNLKGAALDNDRPEPLEGQVAVVTGGGRGIGRAIALALAAARAEVAICARSVAKLEETATRTDAELGPVDLLVNNAGMGGVRAHVWEADPKAWWRTQEVNLLGPFVF